MIKRILCSFIVTCCLLAPHSYAAQPTSKATTAEKQGGLSPKRALALLKEGNQRFMRGELRQYNFAKEMKITSKKGQHPLAVILSCIDSRSIPDILFDQGLGNVFVSRIAGNVADKEILGSMEFASLLAGAPLIVVMGHTHCGAVEGACAIEDTGLSNLNYLLDKIRPAVGQLLKNDKPHNCKDMDMVNQIARQNVLNQLQYIVNNSEALKQAFDLQKIMLVGGMHHITSGKVDFFNIKGEPL